VLRRLNVQRRPADLFSAASGHGGVAAGWLGPYQGPVPFRPNQKQAVAKRAEHLGRRHRHQVQTGRPLLSGHLCVGRRKSGQCMYLWLKKSI